MMINTGTMKLEVIEKDHVKLRDKLAMLWHILKAKRFVAVSVEIDMNTSQVNYNMRKYRLSNYGACQSMATIAYHIYRLGIINVSIYNVQHGDW